MSKLLISLMLLMTLAEFRARDESAQVYMVVGAQELLNYAGITCKNPTTVGEDLAYLRRRNLDTTKPWIEHWDALLKVNGCKVEKEKGDT